MHRVKPQKSKLRDDTLQLLKGRDPDLSLPMIAKETGLSFHWLRDFSENQIKNPGVCFVETLFNYLKEKHE